VPAYATQTLLAQAIAVADAPHVEPSGAACCAYQALKPQSCFYAPHRSVSSAGSSRAHGRGPRPCTSVATHLVIGKGITDQGVKRIPVNWLLGIDINPAQGKPSFELTSLRSRYRVVRRVAAQFRS